MKTIGKKAYAVILIGLSLLITLLIASEEAEFLMTVFEGDWVTEKAVAICLFNAIVPIIISGAFAPENKIDLKVIKIPVDLIRYRLPVFILGLIVLSFASYQTAQKYLGEINTKNWAASRIVELDNQIKLNERLLGRLDGQKTNTAITVRLIQDLQKDKRQIENDPTRSQAEAWLKVILLTGTRVVLWFLAISMSRRAFEIIRTNGDTKEKIDLVQDELMSQKSTEDLKAKELENEKLKSEVDRHRSEIEQLRQTINKSENASGLNEFEIKKKLANLRENKEMDIRISINGEKKAVSPTHRSILINYALPFVKTLMNDDAKTA